MDFIDQKTLLFCLSMFIFALVGLFVYVCHVTLNPHRKG